MAIDYGLKRTGIAVTDPLQIIANGLDTDPSHTLLKFLEEYFAKELVDDIVIGMPKNLENQDTDSTQSVRNFVKAFEKKFSGRKLILHDERFTSHMAMQTMIAGGMSKKDRRVKGTVDRVSATIILQSYMEGR